jgi:predicted acylesterase/phospholipase RssA
MSDPYADPGLQCDIVMKGGITSGVVYPGAAVRLAMKYRFRAIGGTSAGAIAAAIVAAAEHRRRQGLTDGFATVERLADELAGPEDGEPLLLELFQPDEQTRPLFATMMAFMKNPKMGIFGLIEAFPLYPAIAGLIAGACVVLRCVSVIATGTMAAGILAALIVLVAGLVAGIVRAVFALPANGFGLCTLGPRSVGSGPALTAWLHQRIQTIAGRAVDGPVLTFADLWGVTADDPDTRQADLVARSIDPGLRDVDLQMMTTDLTHGRPWRLPAPFQRYEQDRLEFGGELLFKPDELERFFPPEVVAHLVERGGPVTRRKELLPDEGRDFRCFPIGPDLPVLVATRMSLSFPGLICAIPLWQLEFTAKRPDEQERPSPKLQRVFFSDGGITSNFPVHFFDAPLPGRPTFGLHLTTFPAGVKPPEGIDKQHLAIVPPADPAIQAPEDPREIVSLPQFVVAIKDAMQNWRDNTQARQPGFRDRMVHIQLGHGEGGLTLTMNRPKVLDLSARGGAAADVLVNLFAQEGNAPDTPWNKHRFVRFRVATAVTEDYLASFAAAYWTLGPVDRISMSFKARAIVAQRDGVGPYCYVSKVQLDRALAAAEAYNRPLPAAPARQLGKGAPRPPSILRTLPPT